MNPEPKVTHLTLRLASCFRYPHLRVWRVEWSGGTLAAQFTDHPESLGFAAGLPPAVRRAIGKVAPRYQAMGLCPSRSAPDEELAHTTGIHHESVEET